MNTAPSLSGRILITGGAGFIGSHLANCLTENGHRVRVIDALSDQVHGSDASFPKYLHLEVECFHGDVRSRDDMRKALSGVTHVVHLAAAVGVGQPDAFRGRERDTLPVVGGYEEGHHR